MRYVYAAAAAAAKLYHSYVYGKNPSKAILQTCNTIFIYFNSSIYEAINKNHGFFERPCLQKYG